jgi:MFS family permease
VLGISAAAVYAGVSCGPVLAGLLVGACGWPLLFRATALAAACAWLLMRRGLQEEWRPNRGEPFDAAGCLSYGAFMLLLTAGASSLQHAKWALPVLWGAPALLVLYVWLEWRAPYPLLELRLFTRNRVFTLSALASFVNYAAGIGLGFYFSVYLQTLRGFSVEEAGIFMAVQAIVQMIVAPFAGRLADRHGPGRISTLGIFLCGAGIASASFIGMNTPLAPLIGIQLVLGLGFGLFATPNTTIILESAGSRYLGQAAGLTGAVRTGGMLASMIIVTLSLSVFVGHEPVSPANAPAFMESMRLDFLLFSGLNLFALVCSLGRMSYDRKRVSEKFPPPDRVA